MPDPGLTYVSGNYTAGPGISAPSKVFGPEQVAELTNNRLDQYVQDKKQEQAKNQAKLGKMLSDLDVKPTGMFEKDLPEFVKAKQALEDFYTQAQVAGVDPNNPRFLEQYTKAKKYKDGLQAMVQQSVNNNKEFIEAVKKLDSNKNDQFDFDSSQKNLEAFKNGTFEERNKLIGNLLVPNNTDYEHKFMLDLYKNGLLKPDTTKVALDAKNPVKYDKARLKELEALDSSGNLKGDEQNELKDLRISRDENQKLVEGYDVSETNVKYGDDITFKAKDANGNVVDQMKLPSQTLGAAREMMAPGNKAGDKSRRELINLSNGKDASGQIPQVQDPNYPNDPTKTIDDPIAQETYRNLYYNLQKMAAGYGMFGGQPITGDELYAAQKISAHANGIKRAFEAKETPAQAANARYWNSGAGRKEKEQTSFADDIVNQAYSWLTGDPKHVHMDSDGRNVADLVGYNSYLGAEYKKGFGNRVEDAQFIKRPDGTTVLRVKSSASKAKAAQNPTITAQYEATTAQVEAIENNPKVYDKNNPINPWKDISQKADYEKLQNHLTELEKAGGSGYTTYTVDQLGTLAQERVMGIMHGHGDLATVLGEVKDAVDRKLKSVAGKNPSYGAIKSSDKAALQQQLEDNLDKMNYMSEGPDKADFVAENTRLREKIKAIEDKEVGTKTSTKKTPPPKTGDVVSGHKFKGGDPNKPENWEVVK